jgi:hypothetical protein
MKKIDFLLYTAAILLTGLTAISAKAEYVNITRTISNDLFSVDTNSIVINGRFVEASIDMKSHIPRNKIASGSTRERFDCSSRSRMRLEGALYDINGKLVVSARDPNPIWQSITPGSAEEGIYFYICNYR